MLRIKRINLPIVVTTVLEKNNDCPKLQFGSPETLREAETPRLLARTISLIKFSKSSSVSLPNPN